MQTEQTKIVHVTSVHPRYDMRIFTKMCSSLAASDYDVTLCVADGKGDEVKNGVKILDMAPNGRSTARLKRMLFSVFKTFATVKKVKGDIYHLHDPELMPLGIMLRAIGRKVIFDAHEDLPKQILTKNYLNPNAAKVISKLVLLFEKVAFRQFTGLVGATEAIKDKLSRINNKAYVVNNFAILGELSSGAERSDETKKDLLFVGGMTAIRGIEELVAASKDFPGKLHLVGEFSPASFEQELRSKYSFENVVLHGFLGRTEVAEMMSKCAAGFVTYLPCPNHIEAQPNKLFEYMSASLPVIASDYPLWREIVIDNNCGLCVDPSSVAEISAAVSEICDSGVKQAELGNNGHKAVIEKYNWQQESKKLINIYKTLI